MAAKCCRCFPTAPYVLVGLLMLPFLPVCLQSQTGGVPGSPLAPSQSWWELSLSAPLCNQQLAPALSSLANPYLGRLRTTEFLSHCSLLRRICSRASPGGTSWRHFQQSCPVRRAPTRAPRWALLWREHCSQLCCQHLIGDDSFSVSIIRWCCEVSGRVLAFRNMYWLLYLTVLFLLFYYDFIVNKFTLFSLFLRHNLKSVSYKLLLTYRRFLFNQTSLLSSKVLPNQQCTPMF